MIVLNWNGKDLLRQGLPSVCAAASTIDPPHEVIVVDNGSTDGSADFVREEYPHIRLVELPKNIFFIGGNNAGARAASHDVIVLLNNDMVVDEHFIEPLTHRLRAGDVFAVGSQIFFEDPNKRREETGKTRGEFSGGVLRARHAEVYGPEAGEDVPVLWASGGAVAIDRNKFLAIGGFDHLYDPFYVEDTDLCYRAWKVGWRCLFAAESRVIHKHRATNRPRWGTSFVENTIRRNNYLFIWHHITDPGWILEHFALLPVQVLRAASEDGLRFTLRALMRAIGKYPQALGRRYATWRDASRTDVEIFGVANTWFPRTGEALLDFSEGEFGVQLGAGWYGLEGDAGRTFRWIDVRATAWLFNAQSLGTLVVDGYLPDLTCLPGARQTLELELDGRSLGKRTIEANGSFRFAWNVPQPSPDKAVWWKVTLRAGASYVPAELGLGEDHRSLALCVSRVGFCSA